MIIGDGAPENNREVFELHNWRDPPYKPVRVFTYLIGKEVANWDDIRWMACENQGYYVHLSDTAEVREMVLNYIPVMARPLVLGRHDHPVIWSQVYADIEVGSAPKNQGMPIFTAIPPLPSNSVSNVFFPKTIPLMCVGHEAIRLSVGHQSVRVPEGRCPRVLAGARSDAGAQRNAPPEVQKDEGGKLRSSL